MTRITDERLAEIDKLHRECTQGPYVPCPDKAYIFAPNSKMIASSSYREEGVEDGTVELRGDGAGLPMDANHDFLVASWEIVKDLREEVLALRGELADLRSKDAVRAGGFETALRIANGCTDYGGGYRSVERDYEIYQSGIATVIAALTRARADDTQTQALIDMGAAAIARAEHPMQVLEVEPHPDAAKHVRALLLAGVEVADMRTEGAARSALLSNFGVQAEAAHRTYAANAEALRREGCICGEYAAITGLLHPDCPAHPEPITSGLELPAAALFGGPPTDSSIAIVRSSVVPPAEAGKKFLYKATWEAPDGTLITKSLEPGQGAIVSDEGVVMQPDEDPPLTELEQLRLSHPKCSCCGAIATCFGTYEGNANWGYGCDACCGHGCEDGRCTALESDSQIAAETAQKIAIENNKLDAELFELKKEKT